MIEATSTCLRVINDANQFSRTLPPSMSARFRLGTGLAQACQVRYSVFRELGLLIKINKRNPSFLCRGLCLQKTLNEANPI